MDFGEAFKLAASLSSEELRRVLGDPFADVVLRAAAALIMAKRRDLAVGEKVDWLLEGWESAALTLRKYVLEALGNCPTPKAIAWLMENIVPICNELIRSGSDQECCSVLGSLMRLSTPEAVRLVEGALQSASSETCREHAAFLLVLNGISTGETFLQEKLTRLQPVQVERSDPGLQEKVFIDLDYYLTASALAQINNKGGLLALKQLLDLPLSNPKVDSQNVRNMMHPILKMPETTNLEDWNIAMRKWINERLQLDEGGERDILN